MAGSVHVVTRSTKSGKRYIVRYRRGGRGYRLEHGGSFRRHDLAKERETLIGGWLALGLDPKAELMTLTTEPEHRELASVGREWLDSRIDLSDQSRRIYGTYLDSLGQSPLARADPSRLASVQSHRYSYWEVAAGAFADHPLRGAGSAGFRNEWLRERDLAESARDAHSLYVETAAELGVLGLLALAALFTGVALAARDGVRRNAALVAGPAAGLTAWATQAGVDWLWEMPALALLGLSLLAIAARMDEPPAPEPARAPRPRGLLR